MKAFRFIALAVCAALALCSIVQAQTALPDVHKVSGSTTKSGYRPWGKATVLQDTPPVFLIVAVDSFQNTLASFVQWKVTQGFDVETYYAPRWQRETLRDMLKRRYYDITALKPAPTYLLLVGDAAQIAAWQGRQANEYLGDHHSDLYYAEYDGDGIPEVMQGRWPAQNKKQLAAIVSKTIAYEQYDLQDTSYLNHALLVAGYEERGNADTITNGQIHYLSRQLMLSRPAMDTHCFYNPESSRQRNSILATWQQGVAMVNYTAHCLSAGWNHPWIGIDAIDSLPADGRYSFVVNNCCHSNDFSTDCFGEALLQKAGGGAIGVIGAMAETLWDEDCFWAIGAKQPFSLFPSYDNRRLGAYDRLLHCHGEHYGQQAETLGEILWAGNQAVADYGSLFSQYYWEVYCLLGDPSLMPYVGIPQHLSLACGDSLATGIALLHFTGTPHAFVAVSEPRAPNESTVTLHDRLLGVCQLDSTGHGMVRLKRPLASDSVIFCATAQNHIPIIENRPVLGHASPVVVATEVILADKDGRPTHDAVCLDTLSLTVTWKNVGSGTAHNLLLTIASTLPDGIAPFQTSPLLSSFALDNLEQDSTYTTVTRFVVGTSQPSNALQLLVYATQQGDTMPRRWLTYSLIYPEIVLEEVSLLLQDASDPRLCLRAHQVLPGQKYWLQIVAHNTGITDAASSRVCITRHEGVEFTTATCHTGMARQAGTRDTLFLALRSRDTLSRLFFYIETYCNDLFIPYPVTFLADSAMETFESATLTRYPWDCTTPLPWQVDSLQSHSGHYSARSATIAHRQCSDLSITVHNNDIDSVAFWAKTSSENGGDKLVFYIDGNAKKSWSGEQEWRRYRYMLTPGQHTLTWRYLKDAAISSGADAAWVDDIRLPLSMFPQDSIGYDDTLTRQANIPVTDDATRPVRCYPNPTSDILWVDNGGDASLKITLWDNMGRNLITRRLPPQQSLQLQLHDLPSGNYILSYQSRDARHNTIVIIKNN